MITSTCCGPKIQHMLHCHLQVSSNHMNHMGPLCWKANHRTHSTRIRAFIPNSAKAPQKPFANELCIHGLINLIISDLALMPPRMTRRTYRMFNVAPNQHFHPRLAEDKIHGRNVQVPAIGSVKLYLTFLKNASQLFVPHAFCTWPCHSALGRLKQNLGKSNNSPAHNWHKSCTHLLMDSHPNTLHHLESRWHNSQGARHHLESRWHNLHGPLLHPFTPYVWRRAA